MVGDVEVKVALKEASSGISTREVILPIMCALSELR